MKYREILGVASGLKALVNKEIGFAASKAVAKNIEILQPFVDKYINFQETALKQYATLKPDAPNPGTYVFNDEKSREAYVSAENAFLDQSADVACMLPEDLLRDCSFITPVIYAQLKPILA